MTYNELYDVVIKINSENMFIRKEGDDTFTLRNEGGFIFLDSFESELFTKIDGQKNIKELFLDYTSGKPIVNYDLVFDKFLNTLNKFNNLNIIHKIDCLKVKPTKFGLAWEADYIRIEKYINRYWESNEKYSQYSFFPNVKKGTYNLFNIRMRSFNFSENFYIMEEDNNIKGLVGISGLRNDSKTVAISLLLFDKSVDLGNLFFVMFNSLKEQGVFKVKICSVRKLDKEMEEWIEQFGFKFETKMISEDFGKDVYVYSCFLSGGIE